MSISGFCKKSADEDERMTSMKQMGIPNPQIDPVSVLGFKVTNLDRMPRAEE